MISQRAVEERGERGDKHGSVTRRADRRSPGLLASTDGGWEGMQGTRAEAKSMKVQLLRDGLLAIHERTVRFFKIMKE